MDTLSPLGNITVDMIEDHISNKSKIAISPERNELNNFDYINHFKIDLNKKLSATHWLKLHQINVRYNIKEGAKNIVNASNTNSTLFIGTTYYLNSTFERLEVSAYVKFFAKEKNKQSPLVLYKNNFYCIYYLSNKNKKAENEQIWTKKMVLF